MTREIGSALLFCALGALSIAHANETSEVEPNHPVSFPQLVSIPGDHVAISAVLGNVAGARVDDLDFYTFYGQEGDLVTADIDGGMGGARGVDTVIAIFSTAPGYPMLRLNDDAPNIDTGSSSLLDSRIDNFRLPATGYYVVGVSNYPRTFRNGASVDRPTAYENGDYKLVISGVTNPMVQINIDVKPGSGERAPVNPKSKGKIPVALLSSMEFNAVTVKTNSLTFGPSGDERSLSHCGDGVDVNGDGRLDLVCHFKNQLAGFEPGDLEAIVRGTTGDGRPFEGRGLLKVVPEKRWR